MEWMVVKLTDLTICLGVLGHNYDNPGHEYDTPGYEYDTPYHEYGNPAHGMLGHESDTLCYVSWFTLL